MDCPAVPSSAPTQWCLHPELPPKPWPVLASRKTWQQKWSVQRATQKGAQALGPLRATLRGSTPLGRMWCRGQDVSAFNNSAQPMLESTRLYHAA